MSASIPVEREYKFAFAPDTPLPELTGFGVGVVDRGTVLIEAVYWDTEQLALMHAGFGARRRRGIGWTLKGPSHLVGGALIREEREWPDAERPPVELLRLVADVAGELPLVAVARLRTSRHRIHLMSADSVPLLEVDDDDVAVIDAGAEVDRFREVEVEVVGDAPEPLIAAVVEHVERGGGVPGTGSKYVRALGVLGRIAPR